MRIVPTVVAALVVAVPAGAQESSSYKLAEHAFNAGGHPANGASPASTGYGMTLDALGDACVGPDASSASYRMSSSLTAGYPPPGQVWGLRFSDRQTLVWEPERSVGVYNLYRDRLNSLPSLGYGSCEQPGLTVPTATDSDPAPAGDGFFYLVTATNRLGEEGTKGQGDDQAREGNACP
jgi:hypothetical protein